MAYLPHVARGNPAIGRDPAVGARTAADAATSSAHGDEPGAMRTLRPSRGWVGLNLRELWRYRGLLYFLVWKNVKVRYKQTILGGAWAILQPLGTVAVFSVFFGRLGHIPSDGVPYPIFSLAGLVPWSFFSLALNESANSLIGSQQLITKVYFPRLAIPISTVVAALVDFAVMCLLLLVFVVAYGVVPGVRIVWLPLFVLLTILTSLGAGLWLAALNVSYRDVRYLLPFFTQLWMFLTPIAYPSSLVPDSWRAVYGLNPMVGVVDGFRWALLGTQPPGAMLVVSSSVAVALMLSGVIYFRRRERMFADVI
jgi:lipopolysaccharide transport system permease protein